MIPKDCKPETVNGSLSLDLKTQDLLLSEVTQLLGLKEAKASASTLLPEATIQGVEKYRDFLVHAVTKERIKPSEDIKMLKEFLKAYKLRLPFELEDYVDEGDLLEIHTEDLVQIYRNRAFFDYCSYDLCTLLSHPFDVLFRRDPEVSERLVKIAVRALKEGKTIERVDAPPHYMQEHFARNNRVFRIEHKWISPVYSNVTNQVLGIFSSQSAQVVGTSNVTGIGFINH